MRIVVIADMDSKEELLAQGLQDQTALHWLERPEPGMEADVCIDLLFDHDPERIALLDDSPAWLILVNDVSFKTKELPSRFLRFNGWKSFLRRPIVELSPAHHPLREKAETVFGFFGKKAEWLDGMPGYMSARVVSMIINEAYLGLAEGLSTKEEMDTAMKLGTGYPYGPFEWAGIIGIKKVVELLQQLAAIHPKYQPATLMQQEADAP